MCRLLLVDPLGLELKVRKKAEKYLIDLLCAGRHCIFQQPPSKRYFSSMMLPECFPPTHSLKMLIAKSDLFLSTQFVQSSSRTVTCKFCFLSILIFISLLL